MWQLLKTETRLMILLKDQLQVLWEGLRSMRSILRGNPKFDKKMRDLTQLLLCDAGLVLFSLSLSATKDESIDDMDLESFNNFVVKLDQVKEIVPEICPETSKSSNFPRIDVLGFLDFLVKYMMDLTNLEKAGSLAFVNYPISRIQEELDFLRSNFMVKIVDMRLEDEELQALWDHVGEVAYRVEFLLDSILVGGFPNSRTMLFDSIVDEIKIIKADALKISDTKRLDLKVKEDAKTPIHMPSQESKAMINNVPVGLEDETTSIINRLTAGSSNLQIVPITGVPGLGKTTQANKVYNDLTVRSRFYARAWCTVTHAYHKKRVLLEILTCIHSGNRKKFSELCEADLSYEVKKKLLRNKYLIVLDDVWDTEVWNDLEILFPDCQNGSRVILTSRNHDIVGSRVDLNNGPHRLRELNSVESWDLLNVMLYAGKEEFPSPKLCQLREQIVEMCQGLPLAIIILAGMLATQDEYLWDKIVESVTLSIISSTEPCTATLQLSYQNLPDNLKRCFLYFGAFPEDYKHYIEDLICLWVAEGFVQESEFKSAEDVANDYMMGLIGRSLIKVSEQSSIGGVKTCRVHDLLHEFCVKKGTGENFLQFVHGHEEPYTMNVPCHLRHLSINYNSKNFYKFRLFAPGIRSISFFSNGDRYPDIALIVRMFKLVEVLDLSQVKLVPSFPRELELLVQLRYLAIQGEIRSIPSFIGNLLHLETFIIVESEAISSRDSFLVSLPDTIWNLKELGKLQVKNSLDNHTFECACGFEFPTDHLANAAKLSALHTLSSVGFCSLEKLNKMLRQFPNIRKLKCIWNDDEYSLASEDAILVLDFLSKLESLTLEFYSDDQFPCQFKFQFSFTIRELTLSGFRFPWSKISAIGELPNLEILNLLEYAFDEGEWNVEEEEFPKVRYLKLSALDIVQWTSDCEDCFPSLRKLVLEWCDFLKDIPYCLGRSTLEVIEVRGCPNSEAAIQQVKEEQEDLGNYKLKIIKD